MDKARAAIQQALEAIGDCSPNKALVKAAYALQEALAEQAEQEPVAWMRLNEKGECENIEYIGNFDEHLYLPPSCQWLYASPVQQVDLTDDEIEALWASDGFYRTPTDFARAIIAADRRKNRE